MFRPLYLIFLLYGVLLFGFFLNLDPNGGANTDYINHTKLLNDLKNNFKETIFNYDKYSTRHSPVLYVLLSFLYKLNIPDQIVRFLSLHFCLFLPIIFYKSLLIKFNSINKNYILIFTGSIFLSPTFLSLSIWPDSRIFGLIFFCLSIFYFLKFKNGDEFKNAIKCILAYTLASYLSPNFSVFSIFYFYFFYKKFLFTKKLFVIIILNLILSIPAFWYIFSLENIFLLKYAAPTTDVTSSDFFNFANKILIISSIIFVYLIPFLITKSINIRFFDVKNLILSFLLIFFLAYFFNYNYDFTGGGIFFKFSYFIFNNNLLFFVICFISLNLIFNLIKFKSLNLLLIAILVLSNPQYTIYHKYYDPLLLIMFPLLFSLNLNTNNLFNYRSIAVFYIYTGSFLILNFLK